MEKKDNFLRLKKILEFAYNNEYSDFYRIKYQKAGFNPLSDFNSMHDIKKIPFLAKEEIMSLDPYKLLFVDEKKVTYVGQTTGTTGNPIFFFHSTRDNPTKVYGKRCLCLCRTSILLRQSRIFTDIDSWMIAGDVHNIPATLQMASKLKIDTIHANVGMAIIIYDYLQNYPELKNSLKRLILNGEVVGPERKKFLQKLYPGIKIFLLYGSAEGGQIALQCEHLAKKENGIYYHPEFHIHNFEIIDPNSEKETKMGEKGELVLTNLSIMATPIIRYRTGDLVNFKEISCSCGLSGPLLQIWGRVNYDSIRAGGFEFRTDMLEIPMLNLRDCLQDSFEITVSEIFNEGKQKLKISVNLSLKDGIQKSLLMERRIKNELLDNWQLSPRLNLGMAVKAGIIDYPKINFVQFPKSQKPKRVFVFNQA